MSAHLPTTETPLFGQMVIPGVQASALPLQKTSVTAQITGPLAVVSVAQEFENPLNTPIELEYLFPLPHTAALVEFEILVGLRTLRGDLQEIKKAQQAYEDARQAGQQGGLLEQRRPNLFSIKIANVRPGENLRAVMRYQERITFDNQYEFVFPMGITPKYHTAENPEERQGVDAPLASQEERMGPVEICIAVDAGFPIADPTSPSHLLAVTRLDARRFNITLANNAIPDHDFVLRYAATEPQTSIAAWRSSGEHSEYFLATLVPPALNDTQPTPPPREFIFVFDRSGSMSGEPIAQARNALQACLRILNPEDTFYILFFDDQIEWFRKETSPVTQEIIDAADRYLSKIEGRGGTEILRALDEALSLPQDIEKRGRYIIFLTDGAVSAEERMLEQIRHRLSNERIFTFGIGPSVNRALLSELARLGRGMAEFLQLDEDIEGAIMRFQDRVSYPLLTDITIQYENCKVWDVYPQRLTDLYAGQPIELCGRIKSTGKKIPTIQIQAHQRENIITKRLELSSTSPDLAIQRAWARARLDNLLEEYLSQPQNNKLRNEIISLALEYRLVTPFTAFVALDSEVVLHPGEKATFIQVSQPLPAGLDLQGFAGGPGSAKRRLMSAPPPPSMAMPASFASAAAPQSQAKLIARNHLNAQSAYAEDGTFSAADQSFHPLSTSETLRLLARSQNLNGSWNNDLETTAAALLAFIRQGNSPQNGLYRRQMRKALNWLLAQPNTSQFADFVRALAMHELHLMVKSPEAEQAALSTRQQLPSPSTALEQAAWQILQNISVSPGKINVASLDDLRLAGLQRIQPEQPFNLPADLSGLLAQIWLACI